MGEASAKPLRVGYFGDGPWANRALRYVVEDGRMEVAFITPRYSNPDAGLRSWAVRLGIPFLLAPDVNAPSFLEAAMSHGADLFVSMSFDQIVKRPFIDAPPHGAVNCHAGALPFYRGRNPLNWALINGETHFGITVHYLDEGIDTGDIIVQHFSPIAPTDTYADLLARAHELCAKALLEALIRIHDGSVQPMPQSDNSDQHTYFSRRRPGDEWIDWSWSSERLHNFIRAITLPGPCARTMLGDRLLAIVEAEPVTTVPEHIGAEGEVVGRDSSGVLVKTGDTAIKVTKVADVLPDDALDVVLVPRIPLGTRLGINLIEEVMTLRQRIAMLEKRQSEDE